MRVARLSDSIYILNRHLDNVSLYRALGAFIVATGALSTALAQPRSFTAAHPEIRFASTIDSKTIAGLRFSGCFQTGHPIGGVIAVFRRQSKAWREVWAQKNLNPWKLTVADTGDHSLSVLIGVWKKSPYDLVMEKRLFIYSWNGERLLPKWLSSHLAGRFDDFSVVPASTDSGPRLIALERAGSAKHLASTYRQRAFGFDWVASSNEVADADRIVVRNSRVVLTGRHKRYRLILTNEHLLLKEY